MQLHYIQYIAHNSSVLCRLTLFRCRLSACNMKTQAFWLHRVCIRFKMMAVLEGGCMMGLLQAIHRHIVVSILIAMVLGFLIGIRVDTEGLRRMVTPLSFFMVYPMMVTLNFRSLLERGNWKLQGVTQLINFVYLPLLAIVFGWVFFPDEDNYRLGILLIALLPTSGMTVSWTVMAKGNVKEAIRMIVIGLMLGGLITPLYIGAVFSEAVSVPFGSILSQIGLIVFLPMFLGFLTQRGLVAIFTEERFKTSFKPIFPIFSTLAVVVLIGIVMSLRATMLLNNPAVLPRLLIPIILGYLIMLVTIDFIGRRLFDRADRVALINGTMIRSLSLALAVALTVFAERGPAIALVIALAYVVQVQLAAWYVRRTIRLMPAST
ncbi:MAG: arsenic resistance protein [Acholeplasmatales bacterium]|nr:MAG: arsenic resistance protein [Acholeplasmatales bacterium]